MTVTYSINAGAEVHGVQASWQRHPIRQNADGSYTWANWSSHEWQIPVADMTCYETLKTLEGDTITSIETNDIDDRNAGATYTTAIMESIVQGQHIGLYVENITIKFRIDTTA